jgi:hypothetical protein
LDLEVGARKSDSSPWAILTKINPIDYFTRYQVLELPAIFARITSIAAKVLYRSLLYLRPPADQFCGIHSFDGD